MRPKVPLALAALLVCSVFVRPLAAQEPPEHEDQPAAQEPAEDAQADEPEPAAEAEQPAEPEQPAEAEEAPAAPAAPPPSDQQALLEALRSRTNSPVSKVNLTLLREFAGNAKALLPGSKLVLPTRCEESTATAGTGPARFRALYCEVTDPAYQDELDDMREEKVLEEVATDLNGLLRLPGDVVLTYLQCGDPNAFYIPGRQSGMVVLCFELLDALDHEFAKTGRTGEALDQAVADAATFALFHEVGHALVDVLRLRPATKEEDAADQLATYVLADGNDEEELTALHAAVAFDLMARRPEAQRLSFLDHHSLGEERFDNILCWLYGDAPGKYEDLVRDGTLPKARAQGCQKEWQTIEARWNKDLAPALRN